MKGKQNIKIQTDSYEEKEEVEDKILKHSSLVTFVGMNIQQISNY
jgi:hypothetical protein